MTAPAPKPVPRAVPPAPAAVPPPVPAAPVKPPELRAEEKRALREQARREFRAAERERLEAAAKPAAPAAGKATATPGAAPAPADPDRTDAQRAADAAVFLRGFLLPVLSLLAYPFGWRLRVESFTAEQAREDAAAWVPVARRYRWVDLVITWAGVPARLVARVRELAERRAPKESKP